MFYLTFIVLYFRFNIYPVVNILDVGQGDCILIQVNNKNLLIDSGPSSSRKDLLEAFNILSDVIYVIILKVDNGEYR